MTTNQEQIMPEPKEKIKKMASKCLLLKTPDNRCFFTEEKHFPLLVEFGRTFDAEISVVKTQEQVEVLELDDLAKSICNQKITEPTPYDVIEIKLAAGPVKKSLSDRYDKIKKAHELNEVIRAEFLSGKSVSIADLEAKFPDLTKPSLSNHFTRVRRELQTQGYTLVREKVGQYRLIPAQSLLGD